MFALGAYKTRADLLVNLIAHTPKRSFKYVGYFEIRGIRIRVFYKENGDEYFGEKGLDLNRKLPEGGAFLIKPILDPVLARKQVMGDRVP